MKFLWTMGCTLTGVRALADSFDAYQASNELWAVFCGIAAIGWAMGAMAASRSDAEWF